MKERTKYSNMNYECQDIFMVRIPSMPIEVFKKIDSYDQGVISFLNENKTIKGDFEEALLLASQSTYQSLISVPEKPKKNRNLELGVCKYITRMSTRPTPYGMFAGVGLGKFSGRDSLTISTDKHRKDVLVDTYWLEHIIHKIELEANLFPKIELIWNNNCYIKGDRVKNPYFSNHGDNEQNESFENSSIRFNELISIIIKSTQNFVPYSKLVEIIKEYYEDVSNNLIDKILLELIENEYLLTDLRLPAYCDEPLEYVINKLLYLDNIHDLVDKLQDIKKAIDDYQEKGNACILRDIYSKMQKIHKTSNYLVVNKGLTSDFSLTKKVKEDLEKFAEVYSELLPESGTYSELNAFKHDFEEEYGTNVRVPLLEVIDENGFNGLSKIEKQTRTITGKEAIIKGYIDRQIVKALINNGDVVKIESQVLKKLLSEEKIVSPSYPVSFDMNFFIYQDRQPGQYHYSIGPNFGSQKAGKMFQRFANIYNKDLFDKYNQVYLKENFLIQNDYALIEYREIQRKGRVRNVVNNRRNHKYHLDLACIGEEDGRVLLSDLSIGMTEDQKLFIFSEKLNKRCKIITDNMLNPKLCSKLFYFMDAISKEYEDNVTLRKYMLYENVYNFTPRIVIDNFTVSLKTWKFSNQSIKCTDINSFIQCFDKLRNDYSIDQYVYFCESDNRLVINLNKRYSYDILYSAFKRTNQVELTELEPGFMQDEILSDERGQKYEAEFTFSFIQRKSIQKMKNTSYALLKANRILELGDEGWIYIKVYGLGTRTNEFLTKSIPRLIKELDCEKWFFIRYSDPCEHIRFRIKFQNEDTAYTKLKGIMEWIHILKKRGMVEKVIFDTYKREINRYGGEQLIDYAETIFYLDSQLVIEILSNFNIEQEEDKEKLYFVGIAKIYKLFTDKLEDIFKLIDTDQREQYRNDYKTKRNVYLRWFEDILNDNLSNIDARFSNLDSLMKWEEKIKKYRNELDLYTKDNMLCTNKTHLILSFSHMYCNRLNGSLTTEQKYRSLLRHTLYDYLKRLEYKKK